MQAIYESNYTVIKLSRNGNSKAEKKMQFIEVMKHNYCDRYT